MKDVGFPTPDRSEAVLIVQSDADAASGVTLVLRELGKDEVPGTLDLTVVPQSAQLTLAELGRRTRHTARLEVGEVDVADALTQALREGDGNQELWSALELGLARRPTQGWSRVVLAVDPDHIAAELPWEGLRIGDEPVFLDGRCELVRTWPTQVQARSAIVRGEESGALRVLVLLGGVEQQWADGPPDHLLTSFAADDVRGLLEATCEELAKLAPLVEVRVIAPSWSGCALPALASDALDLDEVRRWIRGEKDQSDGFDVVVFVGHSNAVFDATQQDFRPATALRFRFASSIDELSLTDLATDLLHTRSRVLLLQCCWTEPKAMRSLADSVEHVLAWGALISPIACRAFTHSLFRSLAASPPPPIGDAVRVARRALSSSGATSASAWLLAHHARDPHTQAFIDAGNSEFAVFRNSARKKLLRLPEALARYAAGAQVLQDLFVELSIERGEDRETADALRMLAVIPLLRGPRPLRDWIENPSLRRRFLLVGEPGSGKSTLLRHLAAQLLEQGWVAVYVPIQVLLDARITRIEELQQIASRTGFREFSFLAKSRVDRAITTCRFALFLDGLDEVEDRAAAEKLITLLAEQVGVGCVVVASRTDGLRAFDDAFLTARVCELDEAAQLELVGNWFHVLLQNSRRRLELSWLIAQGHGASDQLDAATKAVAAELQRRRPLAIVCRNPLALTLTILRIAQDGLVGLPSSRFQILAWLTEFLLGSKHHEEAPFDELVTPQHVLAHLALFMLEHGVAQCEVLFGDHKWSKLGADFIESLPQDLRTASMQGPAEEHGASWRIDDPRAWVLSKKPTAQSRTVADRLRASGLIEPVDTTVDRKLRFPIQSLADFLAADCLRERFERDPAALRKWLKQRKAAIAANLARWSETLALCTSWQTDDTAKHGWLTKLGAIDLRLGLRALGRADQPPVSAVGRLLARGDNVDKLRFWNGFAQSFGIESRDDAERALELIEQVAPQLSAGTDRCLMEDEAIAAADRFHLPRAMRARSSVAIRKVELEEATAMAAFSTQPVSGESLWRRIELGEGETKRPLWMMAVPVTIGMYRLFDPGHRFRHPWTRRTMTDAVAFEPWDSGEAQRKRYGLHTTAHPVLVCWFEAVAFTRWLNAVVKRFPGAFCTAGQRDEFVERLEGGWRFRLPAETEWEWACRAGTTTKFSCGAKLTSKHAWFGQGEAGVTRPVGLLTPNAFGLRDMHGNVWEWCVDAWASSIVPSGHVRLGGRDSDRALRGGSSKSGAGRCRSASRLGRSPAFRSGFNDYLGFDYFGFRPVLAAPLPSSGSVIEDR